MNTTSKWWLIWLRAWTRIRLCRSASQRSPSQSSSSRYSKGSGKSLRSKVEHLIAPRALVLTPINSLSSIEARGISRVFCKIQRSQSCQEAPPTKTPTPSSHPISTMKKTRISIPCRLLETTQLHLHQALPSRGSLLSAARREMPFSNQIQLSFTTL